MRLAEEYVFSQSIITKLKKMESNKFCERALTFNNQGISTGWKIMPLAKDEQYKIKNPNVYQLFLELTYIVNI